MIRRTIRLILIVNLAFFAGVIAHQYKDIRLVSHQSINHVDAIVYSESLAPYVGMWKAETARRFPDAILLVSHGTDANGQWEFAPDRMIGTLWLPLKHLSVEAEVKAARAKYPGRTLVIMSCNPGHYHISVPNVAYALESVYCVPDRVISHRDEDDDTGSIFEFEFNN